jgi:hypothetical protein
MSSHIANASTQPKLTSVGGTAAPSKPLVAVNLSPNTEKRPGADRVKAAS